MNGNDILLRLGSTADPVEFDELNFPVGSYVMGGSGKLIKVESWTFTVDVQEGVPVDGVIPTAVAKIWDNDWYENVDSPPTEGGRSTTLKASSFGSPAPGCGWRITFPLSTMRFSGESEQSPGEEPVTKVVVPDALVGENPFERPNDENTGSVGELQPVEIPDSHVDQPAPVAEDPLVRALAVGGDKTGPHPGTRTKAGKLYNYVLEVGCAARLDVTEAWAVDAKVAKSAIEIKKLVDDLKEDGWPITIVGDGTDGATISIMGVLVGDPQPSRLDTLRATMFQYGQELLKLGVRGVTIEAEFDETTTIKVKI